MPATVVVANMRSNVPMIDSTDESLMLMTSSLERPGIEYLMPCGNTTLAIACHCDRPSERAASAWPLSTDSMPPRSTSIM